MEQQVCMVSRAIPQVALEALCVSPQQILLHGFLSP